MKNKQKFVESVMAALIFLALCAGVAGCGSGSAATPTPTPTPTPNPTASVSSTSPTSAPVGSAAFTLTVQGSNFISTSTVQWNGSNRTTTFVSSSQLQAQITAADVASAATVAVTVVNPAPGGGTSNVASFTIVDPSPALASISPNSAPAGGLALTLTINGSNFVRGSQTRTVLLTGRGEHDLPLRSDSLALYRVATQSRATKLTACCRFRDVRTNQQFTTGEYLRGGV